MKKTTAKRVLSSDSAKKRVLRLSRETVRALTATELTQAVSGCDMTTWTTVQPDGSAAC